MRNGEIEAKERATTHYVKGLVASLNWLPRLDSHQDPRGQNPACSCYTTRQAKMD